MYLAFSNGPVGIQPHGIKASMINKHGSALAIGDVVINQWASGVAYPGPDTVAGLRNSPFSNVRKVVDGLPTDGAALYAGYIGVVTGLGQNNGADGTEVEVQFGGIANAKVNTTSFPGRLGTPLHLSATAGVLTNNTGSAAPNTTVAICLASTSSGVESTVPVLLFNGPISGSDASSATVP